MVACSPGMYKTMGLIPSQVKLKTIKLVFVVYLLSRQHEEQSIVGSESGIISQVKLKTIKLIFVVYLLSRQHEEQSLVGSESGIICQSGVICLSVHSFFSKVAL